MTSTEERDARSLRRDIAVAWRTGGWPGLKGLLPVGRVYLRQKYVIIEQSLDEAVEVSPPNGVSVERFTGPWSRLRSIVRSRTLAQFMKRAEAGRTCLVATRGADVIGYTWISETMDPEIEHLPLALPPDAAYLWDLFVTRSERSHGIGSALVGARLALARDLGFRSGWRAVSPDNRPSLRTAERTGAVRLVGELRHVRIFGRERFHAHRYGAQPVLAVETLKAENPR